MPPRKRGRKAKQDNNTAGLAFAQDSGAARPGKRGRPRKNNEQHAAKVEPEVGYKERAGRDLETIAGERVNSIQKGGKVAKAPADEDLASSEPRRSRRERRAGYPDMVLGTNQPDQSSRHTATTTPSDPQFRPTKQTKPASNLPSSTPRRGARERRPRDPAKVFGGRRDGNEAEPTQAAEQPRPKTRSKAPQEGVAASRFLEPVSSTEEAVVQKRRGHSSLDRNESPGEGPSRPRRTKQKEVEEAQASILEPAEGDAQPKRRGRPRTVAAAQEQDSELRRSSSFLDHRGRSREGHEGQEPASAKRKRKAPASRPPEPQAEDASSESGEEQQLPFRYLQETIRDIPRSTVAKWNSLDPTSINAVNAFLADAQRPVLLRLQDTNRRREHASAALSQISRRVRTKLAKGLPFPPPTGGVSTRTNVGSYEDEFDFERTVDAVQTMENTLNPLLHSVGLLEKEIEREEDGLAREYDDLHKLEMNAKAKAKEWENMGRRDHVLAPGMKTKGVVDGREPRHRLELVPAVDDEIVGGLFTVSQLVPVAARHQS